MKILLYTILLFLPFTALCQEVKEAYVSPAFGYDRHCRVVSSTGCIDNIEESKAVATSVFTYQNDLLTLTVNRAKVDKDEDKIVGEPLETGKTYTYRTEEYLPLNDFEEALGLPAGAVIPVGDYPVTVTKETVEIVFKIE